MKRLLQNFTLFFSIATAYGQIIDTSKYSFKVDTSSITNNFFKRDSIWLGADGASSIDLENGKVLWLFSDSFICKDKSQKRMNSTMIRNSIAIQDGYDLDKSKLKYYWNKSDNKQNPFFYLEDDSYWLWTGHGIMIKDKLIVFLMKERSIETGIGFETFGWYAVLISNPYDEPSTWKMEYIEGEETFGAIAGSAAVLKDENYLYSYSCVEPSTHEIYLLRWNINDVYNGNLKNPLWWYDGKWQERKTKLPIPEPLFIGGTEFSVHYDTKLKKYIQIQSFGFGEGKIGIRMSDNIQGKWTELYMFYTPEYPGVKKPFMYAAKAHPKLHAEGIYITYNVNSFNFEELIENQTIYFPKFILMKVVKNERQ